MKIAEIISEFAEPTEGVRAQTYYHGTGTTKQANQILQQGLAPGNISGKALGKLTPVSGATYLTPSLRYGIIYAIGGDMLGNKDPSYLINKAGGDPYGYLFVIPGELLVGKIQPDEDSVGAAIHHAYDIIEKDAASSAYYSDPLYSNMMKPENRMWVAEFLRLARYGLTTRQFKDAVFGYVASQAAGGKRFLKTMSPGMKMKLISLGAHVAYLGSIMPTQCWRIDRNRNPELAHDGSNFFQIAERIR